MSVQYYEALSPSIVASLASVIIEQSLMSGGIFGGKVYVFSPLTLTPAAFLYAAGCGVVAGLCSIAIVLGLRVPEISYNDDHFNRRDSRSC